MIARLQPSGPHMRVWSLVLLGVLVLNAHGLSLPSRPLGTKATRTQQRIIVATPDKGAVANTASTGNSSNNSNSSNDSSGSAAAVNGGLGPRVARTMRAARAGALIGLRGVATTLVGHAALQ